MARMIAATEVSKSPRGRTVQTDPELVKLFGKLKPGQACVLEDEFPPAGADKSERARIGQIIRKNFKAARTDHAVPSVNFTAEGVAQVSIHEAKTAAAQEAAKAEASA